MQVHCQQRDLRRALFGGRIRYTLRSAKDIVTWCFFNWGFWIWSLEPRTSIVETWNGHLPGHTIFVRVPAVIFPGFWEHRWYTELGIFFLSSTVVALLGYCKLPLENTKSLGEKSIQAPSETTQIATRVIFDCHETKTVCVEVSFCSLLPNGKPTCSRIKCWKTILSFWNGPNSPKDNRSFLGGRQ